MLNLAFTWFKHVQKCSNSTMCLSNHHVCLFNQNFCRLILNLCWWRIGISVPHPPPPATPCKRQSQHRETGGWEQQAQQRLRSKKMKTWKSWENMTFLNPAFFFWFWRINLGTPGNFMLSVVFKGEATGNHGFQTWFHGWLMVKSHEIILDFLVKILVKKLHGLTLSRYKFRCSPKISHDITWPLGPKNDFYYWTWPKSYGWAHAYGISLWYSYTNVGETVRNDSYFPWGLKWLKASFVGVVGGSTTKTIWNLNAHRNWCENRVREHPVA